MHDSPERFCFLPMRTDALKVRARLPITGENEKGGDGLIGHFRAQLLQVYADEAG